MAWVTAMKYPGGYWQVKLDATSVLPLSFSLQRSDPAPYPARPMPPAVGQPSRRSDRNHLRNVRGKSYQRRNGLYFEYANHCDCRNASQVQGYVWLDKPRE